MRKIIEAVEISEAGVHDFKKSTIKDVVAGRVKVADYISSTDKNVVLGQIKEYVKSLKSLKDVKAMLDFCGYTGKGKEIEKLYNSLSEAEKDELYNYANTVCSQFYKKHGSEVSKIINNFKELDKSKPNIFEELTKHYDHYEDDVCTDFYLFVETEEYAGYANVNKKYLVCIWLKGAGDDDWIGSLDENGLEYNIQGPYSCRKNLYVSVGKIYMSMRFEENWSKIKSGIDRFIKDNFR